MNYRQKCLPREGELAYLIDEPYHLLPNTNEIIDIQTAKSVNNVDFLTKFPVAVMKNLHWEFWSGLFKKVRKQYRLLTLPLFASQSSKLSFYY